MLDFAIEIARAAGAILRDGFRRELLRDLKNRAELVTDMDFASERLLVKRIAARFPEHQIITEEGGGREQPSAYRWLIDPLDGTNNYAHGIHHFSVSIALQHGEQTILGVVYDPLHEEMFTAAADRPAQLNGQPLRVSPVDTLRHARLTSGFAYDRWTRPDTNLPEWATLMMRSQDLRCMGSAALDLCAVAAGRSDGHWELELKPWDSAAGALIVQQAGGIVSGLGDAAYTPWQPRVVASNGLIHRELLSALSEAGEAAR